MDIRVGFGYDVHKLEEGFPFMLGGTTIEHNKGAKGHSDADALLHAICDALLGAANLRDIGYHFPANDPEFKDIDSKRLLTRVIDLLNENNWITGNIDVTVVLQKPRLTNYIDSMRSVIAETIGCDMSQISIKATTTEKMGFVGSEEGVAAYAVALIKSKQ
ncbi:MAG: 2-C-methyl-D-erythritol 2,4-cyclodiphosphate synthase [Bacteroidales bacterium]|nr:2-C-methyl-D-erythritol 2,4-cyclodiphosphate synthase [Bacteroidales bacterium]MCF8334831.1 2-C-methyl-D-erythritol 2,4-cyclodiphosphate synthase [Bacteroidales bacterium]